MKIYDQHPTLPLLIVDDKVIDETGVDVAYVPWPDYLYVYFYGDSLVVSSKYSFDTPISDWALYEIKHNFLYAFRIVCSDGTAVVELTKNADIRLIGVISGFLSNGEIFWTKGKSLAYWPGEVE